MNDDKKGVSKAIYDDLLSPTFRQLGQQFAQLYKVLSSPLSIVLAPLGNLADIMIAKSKGIFEVLSSSIKEKDIVEQGQNQLLIPCLQNLLLYQEKDSKLEQIWMNLLVTSLDKTKQHYAHPAFPILLAQLSYDEIIMLALLTDKSYGLEQYSEFNSQKQRFSSHSEEKNEFPVDRLYYAKLLWFYNDHLHSLNLSGCWEIKNQEPTFATTGQQNGVKIFSEFRIQELGQMLSKACNFKMVL